MSADAAIRAEFKGTIGKFSLDAGFTAPAKGVTALFGPSGCGKTTVLRCIAGLLRVSDGVCEIDGRCLAGPRGLLSADAPAASRLRVPGGEPLSAPHRAPQPHVRRAARQCGGAAGEAIAFDEVVDLLGVTALLDRSPRNLSGGERQRVAIGRALLSQPKLLLMDEPLSALDRATKNEILPFLERLRDRLSLPIVYVTHDMSEVERLADQIVLMEKGRVLAAGPLADLQSDPSLPLAMARDAAVSLERRDRSVRRPLRPPDARRSRRPPHRPRAAGDHRRTSPHSRRRRRRLARARASRTELDPQRPSGAHRFA